MAQKQGGNTAASRITAFSVVPPSGWPWLGTAIMTIAVNERTAEIGLLKSLGATRRQILCLFLGEAMVLASIGGLAGFFIGAGGAKVLGLCVRGRALGNGGGIGRRRASGPTGRGPKPG